MKNKLYTLAIMALLSTRLLGGILPDPNYSLIRADSWVQTRNCYLLTLLEKLPALRQTVSTDEVLSKICAEKKASLEASLKTCGDKFACYLQQARFSEAEIRQVGDRFVSLAATDQGFQGLVRDHLLPSGCYILHAALPPADLLRKAWEQDAMVVNNAIDIYGGLKAPNSPAIDSISFDVKSNIFPKIIYTCAWLDLREAGKDPLFFRLSLNFALNLVEFNDRNRAADFEPMESGCNQAAIARIGTIRWQDYPYSLILVPGEGPEVPGEALSAIGMIRCRIAVARWREGLAPFLMVSGGKVHPYKTPFSEAAEMKRYMVENLHVPENAIIMEPHARHTTTNIRNCNRLIFRYGIPFNKPCLASSDKFQSGYIASENMQERCRRELGYSPYRNGKRLSETESEFFPEINSLQVDTDEPLDP